ncbi:MAG TPA: UDP-N-acetylmuramate dehydrogenase [Actinomycetota bacterium]
MRDSASAKLEDAERILRTGCGKRLRVGFPLAPLTTFRIGGPAALYVEAEDDGDLDVAAEAVSATGIPWIVIGKGSNILVSDRGFPGLVIRLGKGYRWAARDGSRLHAGGSMPLPALAGVALSHSLAGLEFGVAIPASLGGAVRMNAGAHRGSIDQILEQIELYAVAQAGRSVLSAKEAGFRYRHSALPEASLVVGATMRLHAGEPADIRREMEEARAWRKATQPLAEPNCGSVFKNPPEDHAARLVEAVGAKGLVVGAAVVSEKHSNFIVARPGATAADVHRLIRLLQERVEERFGVALEPEVQFIGEFDLASL